MRRQRRGLVLQNWGGRSGGQLFGAYRCSGHFCTSQGDQEGDAHALLKAHSMQREFCAGELREKLRGSRH